jgi:disulfide bond formation protein DsbB
MITFISSALAVLTIIGQIGIIVLLVALLSKSPMAGKIKALVGSRASLFALIVTGTAMLGSLFYSDIALYEPCKLCWYQRILMYPQAIMLALALKWRDHGVLRYVQVFSVAGFLLATYHYLLQLGWVPSIACSTVGYSVDCAKVFVMQFGYITIPLMAATAFALAFLIATIGRKRS